MHSHINRSHSNSQVVEDAEDNSDDHLRHAEDDGQLHLEGVGKGYLVDGRLPDGVKAEGVGARIAIKHVLWLHLDGERAIQDLLPVNGRFQGLRERIKVSTDRL